MISPQQIMADVVAATNAASIDTVIYNLEQVTGVEQRITEINYQHGHQKELEEKLAKWSKDSVKMYKKFPLIWVVEDLQYGVRGDYKTVLFPSIVIAYPTEHNYTSNKREEMTFNPVLRPIFRAFKQAIADNLNFRISDPDTQLNPQTFDRKYWGTPEDEKAQSVFSKPVDAIEIRNLELILDRDCEEEIY